MDSVVIADLCVFVRERKGKKGRRLDLRNGVVCPVILLVSQHLGKEGRGIDERISQTVFASLYHTNSDIWVLGESGGDCEAGSTTADDDVIVALLDKVIDGNMSSLVSAVDAVGTISTVGGSHDECEYGCLSRYWETVPRVGWTGRSEGGTRSTGRRVICMSIRVEELSWPILGVRGPQHWR